MMPLYFMFDEEIEIRYSYYECQYESGCNSLFDRKDRKTKEKTKMDQLSRSRQFVHNKNEKWKKQCL